MSEYAACADELARLADEAAEAVRTMTHVTVNGPALPAPSVYGVLGCLKLVGYGLTQTSRQLAARLSDSATMFELYEYDGRDPCDSISAAMTALQRASEHARAIGTLLDEAQSCIAGQGVRS
jgi:hypothetical protein